MFYKIRIYGSPVALLNNLFSQFKLQTTVNAFKLPGDKGIYDPGTACTCILINAIKANGFFIR